MTDDQDLFEEISTFDLAAEVDSLKAEIADLQQSRVEWADQVAAMNFRQQPEPVWADQSEIVAETPRPRPPQVAPDVTRNVVGQSLSTLAATIPDWPKVAPGVMERVNPSRLTQTVREGPIATAAYLSSLAQSERSAADTRAMKLAAQTASGAGGRTPAPDDFQQRWSEIMTADSGRLGL